MELEAFKEIMTKDNKRACKANIVKVWELSKKTSGIKADNFTKIEIERLYQRYQELLKELEEIKSKLVELASQIDYVEKVVEISGIDYISVIGIIAETGDLRNYNHAKQVLKMSSLSLKESSSGQKKERNISPKEAVLN